MVPPPRKPPEPSDPRTAEPSDILERVVPRRLLVARAGDVVIQRNSGSGIGLTPSPATYQLCIEGRGLLPEQYATFDTAAIYGEQLASRSHVSLYFRESPIEPLYLLRDFR
jgi:hypothetical protein